MLRICLGFPVKISSDQSSVFSVPAIEPEPRRRLEAETQEILPLNHHERT